MIHELKIDQCWYERVKAGAKQAEVREHDRDYQAGDILRLTSVDKHGYPASHYVDRDSRGRFVRLWVKDDLLDVRVTHVLPSHLCDGLREGYCVRSIELIGAR